MPCDADFTNQCELLQSGLAVVSELERTENEDSPRLEQARSYLSRAGQKVRTDGFSQPFAKAIGLATSVAVSHGHDDVAKMLCNSVIHGLSIAQ